MRVALIAAAALLTVPACALAQAKPLLANPADANKDGVVTDEEKADYLAKKAAGAQDQPPTIGVGAPKPGGASTIIMGKPGGSPDYETGAAGEPPAAASDFEKVTEDRIRRDRKDD